VCSNTENSKSKRAASSCCPNKLPRSGLVQLDLLCMKVTLSNFFFGKFAVPIRPLVSPLENETVQFGYEGVIRIQWYEASLNRECLSLVVSERLTSMEQLCQQPAQLSPEILSYYNAITDRPKQNAGLDSQIPKCFFSAETCHISTRVYSIGISSHPPDMCISIRILCKPNIYLVSDLSNGLPFHLHRIDQTRHNHD